MVGELFLIMSGGTQCTEGWDPLVYSILGYFEPPPEEEDSAHETHLA